MESLIRRRLRNCGPWDTCNEGSGGTRMVKKTATAAGWGALAFASYGAVETGLRASLSFLLPDQVLVSWFWELAGWLMAGYVLTGALAGLLLSVATLFVARAPNAVEPFRAGATGLLAIAFCVNLLLAGRPPASAYGSLFFAACLMAAGVLSLRSDKWRQRLRFITSPWTASLLMLVPTWLVREVLHNQEHFQATMVTGALALAVLAASLRSTGGGASSGFSMIRSGAIVGVAYLAIFVVASAMNRKIPEWGDLGTPSPAGNRPNVILLVLDTVRADHLPLYGYGRNTTPELAKLAEQATLFTKAVAASNFTLTTHASMFTGLYPRWHGAHPMGAAPLGRPLGEPVETLAEILAREGYRTMGITANFWYVNSTFGFDQGFQVFDDRKPIQIAVSHPPTLGLLGIRLQQMFGGPANHEFKGRNRRAGDINASVFEMLERSRREQRPFLLFVNYADAHHLLVPPAPYHAMFPGYRPAIRPLKLFLDLEQMRWKQTRLSDSTRLHWISQYDGCLAYLDEQLGRLFDHLRNLGLWDNSLIVVTSDHGESFGEHNVVAHSLSLYQDIVHIPMIVRFPFQRNREIVSATVSHADLLPTILEVAGARPGGALQGTSLRGEAVKSRPYVFSEAFAQSRGDRRYRREQTAVLSGSLKLIFSSDGHHELYDLAQDPGETANLYISGSAVASKLESVARGWRNSAPKATGGQGKLDPATVEKLRSLGYVQ